MQGSRPGARSPVMLVHHMGRATTIEEPVGPPSGSLAPASGGRQRRFTMCRIACAALTFQRPGQAIPNDTDI